MMLLGISLQTQDLTMIFLGARLYCRFFPISHAVCHADICISSVVMEFDLHTVLDALTLAATAWVVYTMRIKLSHTYQAQLDNIYSYYVVGCLITWLRPHVVSWRRCRA